MFTLIPAKSRGRADFGWLDSHHTFSFGDYYDPARMGFRSLRVLNDDRVAPGGGFPTHGHRNMEILSYVLEGALGHDDSMNNGSVIRPTEIQRMSAGTGVRHSEMNASKTEPVHFLQIWLLPSAPDQPPGYEQRKFPETQGLTLLASPDGHAGSVTVHSDASLWRALGPATLPLAEGRHGYVHVARGSFLVNGQKLETGDGAAVSDTRELRLEGEGEALLFDLG